MTQGKKAGRAHRECSFLRLSLLGDEGIGHSFPFFFFSFRSSCLSLFSFVWRVMGGRGKGYPTRIDHFDRGQE